MKEFKSRSRMMIMVIIVPLLFHTKTVSYSSDHSTGISDDFLTKNNFHKSLNDNITYYISHEDGRTLNVKDFGAKGNGVSDDTEAIRTAIAGATDGIVEFPGGSYRITGTIEILLSETGSLNLSGKGGATRILMEGEGPAFRFTGSHRGTSDPVTANLVTMEKELMPTIEGMEIVGKNAKADGLEFRFTFMPVLRGLLIHDVNHGIRLTSRNRNIIIDACHVYNCRGIGIFLDSVNLHQIIISASHISYCRLGGIKVSKSEIMNFQICGNDIEYNYDPKEPVSADIWVDCSERGNVDQGMITGNTIQAIPSHGGANIRFTGPSEDNEMIGLWSVTGNHISNQAVNILLERVRGINITGNTFINGIERSLIIDDCHNLVISDNIIDRNSNYFRNKLVSLDGISILNSKGIILSNNIIDGVEHGDNESGGAVFISRCRDITLTGCHIINPRFRGIKVEHSEFVLVSGCSVKEDKNVKRMLWSMELDGDCRGIVIKNNLVGKGSEGYILINASSVVVDDNVKVVK
jgi:polygalacturonase